MDNSCRVGCCIGSFVAHYPTGLRADPALPEVPTALMADGGGSGRSGRGRTFDWTAPVAGRDSVTGYKIETLDQQRQLRWVVAVCQTPSIAMEVLRVITVASAAFKRTTPSMLIWRVRQRCTGWRRSTAAGTGDPVSSRASATPPVSGSQPERRRTGLMAAANGATDHYPDLDRGPGCGSRLRPRSPYTPFESSSDGKLAVDWMLGPLP